MRNVCSGRQKQGCFSCGDPTVAIQTCADEQIAQTVAIHSACTSEPTARAIAGLLTNR